MEEILELLEDIMDLDEGVLEFDTDLTELEEWDSLSKLSLMADIKKSYGKKITANEMSAFSTVKDIVDYVQA